MKEIDEAFFDLPSNRTQRSKNTLLNEPDLPSNSTVKNKKLIEDYVIKDTIGKGTFSVVKLGEHIKTKTKVAIKILDKEKIKTKEDLTRIKREIKILSILDHPNIIKTYKISETPKKYYIIMEYCEGGELFDYIVEKERLDEFESSIFFYQLINALDYIHSKGVAHRDLKPENLLLSQNKNIKIIDFGLSNFFETGIGGLATPCGSPSYASPEIIKGEIYDGFKIDVWASGIILFAMLCGYLPFDDDEEEEKEESHDKRYFSQSNTNNKEEKSEDNEVLFQKILEGKIEFPDYLSDVAIDLIKKMLVVEPEDRIELDEIKKHKFYRMGKKNYLLYQKTVTEHEVYDNINSFNYDNNTNNYNINISDNSNISNLIDKDKNIINSEMNSLDLSLIKPKKETNIIINNTNNNDESKNDKKVSNNSNIIKNEEIKSEMEEYEKKLFANYLKKVADIKKKNSDKNKTKNNKNKKENKKSIFLNIISSINNKKNFNPKNSIKNTNNYTLNEIVLNFNPINNSIESYKQVIKTPQIQKYNYNYFNNNSFEHKINNSIPLKKLKPIKLKKPEKNIFNLLSQNLNSLNTIEFASKKSNKTKNKFLKEMKYYLSEDKNIDEKKENKNTDRIPKISLSQRYQKNKPVLPAIKTNILDIGNNYNRDIFFANHRFNRHVLTETNNKSTRNKVIFNWNNSERNNFINLRNNIKNSIYKDKYKLSYPSSNKKYNKPIFI